MLQLRDSSLVSRKLLEHRHGGRLLVIELLPQALDEVAGRSKLRRFGGILSRRRNLAFDFRDLLLHRRTLRIDRLPGDAYEGCLVLSVLVGGVVQDRVETEIFPLRERIVFVVVALAAGDCRAHPGAHRGVDPIDDRHRPELFVDRATLAIGERVAMETGGHLVVERRTRQEVAGDLAERELIERHVGVERSDDPVSPAPDRPRRIVGVAGAVGIAGQIEPLPGHMLTVAIVGQQPIDQFFHRIGRTVGHEGVDLLGAQRQACQVEREATGERRPIGLGLRGKPFRLEPRQDETVDVVLRPGGVLHLRHRRPLRRDIRPVRLVGRARRNPAFQEVHLLRRQAFTRIGRRHHEVGIVGGDSLHDLTLVRLARHDRGMAAQIGRSPRERIEPQAFVAAAVPRLRVWTVAPHAAVRQDPLDVAGERRG